LSLTQENTAIEIENLIKDAGEEVKELSDDQKSFFVQQAKELKLSYSSNTEATRRADKATTELTEYKKKREAEIQQRKAELDKLLQDLLDEFGL
jgi:hypothetical protein